MKKATLLLAIIISFFSCGLHLQWQGQHGAKSRKKIFEDLDEAKTQVLSWNVYNKKWYTKRIHEYEVRGLKQKDVKLSARGEK